MRRLKRKRRQNRKKWFLYSTDLNNFFHHVIKLGLCILFIFIHHNFFSHIAIPKNFEYKIVVDYQLTSSYILKKYTFVGYYSTFQSNNFLPWKYKN